MSKSIKYTPELFYPLGPFQFKNEEPQDEFSIVVDSFIKDENGYIKPINEGASEFGPYWVKKSYLYALFSLDSLKIKGFLISQIEKSTNMQAFIEFNEDLLREEEYLFNNLVEPESIFQNATNSAKIIRIKEWIAQKKSELQWKHINDEDTFSESLSDWAIDVTGLLFVLLGKEGIVRRFSNKLEFGRILEKLTRHKAKKLSEHLGINSEDEFFKRPASKKKLDLLITALVRITEYLKNERLKLE